MATLARSSAGVPQAAAALWRGGVRPDRGFYGYDPMDRQTFPSWYVPSHGEQWPQAKDAAAARDRLCGVRLLPGQHTAGAGKGRLVSWLLVNRQGRVSSRNPYSGLIDDLGRLASFRQCGAADGAALRRGTLFRFEARPDDPAAPSFGAYVSMQALLPWTWQDHWHRSLMRATWRRNALDVWGALQAICAQNFPGYKAPELDHSRLPVIHYTHGHPSPPRWKLPIYPETRRPIGKVDGGWDEPEWNFHPAPYGDHRLNPAVYPEHRVERNNLDHHLQNIGRHPYDLLGTRTGNANFPGGTNHGRYKNWYYTEDEQSMHAIPPAVADDYAIWAVYENKYDQHKYNDTKGASIGPWPFQQPVRDQVSNPVVLPP
eukprot:TRINITY_DN50002_c0_g1_i1.p2 TRINITY_DN50002_c0_g1~~TRINITY_DN50002_c0_g1_i1.p2  ORF type:complete len:401 (+),score=94.78 TRINITY_DN50002_c0_g1_i1:90-1205(+)